MQFLRLFTTKEGHTLTVVKENKCWYLHEYVNDTLGKKLYETPTEAIAAFDKRVELLNLNSDELKVNTIISFENLIEMIAVKQKSS